MLATIESATVHGVHGSVVTVEVHVATGLPGFTIVGQPDAACRESRDRVRAAVMSSGLRWPQQRITVNLAPSGLRKSGGGLDLAMAIGVLVASGQLHPDAVGDRGFIAELGLDGSLRAVPGVLPMAAVVGGRELVVAAGNVLEAEVVDRHQVRSAPGLRAVVDALAGEAPWPRPPEVIPTEARAPALDLADVRGQRVARRALEIAAAGGHHLLMVGPPGGGKTMLAERLPSLLGCLAGEAALRATSVHSAAGLSLPPGGLLRRRPFRAPHHTSSLVSMIGGGTASMRPGEVSLASEGVLFLDELGEFPPAVLDALRQPLEQGVIRVARANHSVELPANFLLVAAMNPCPCGAAPSPMCRCTEANLARYRRRVSGPILDRLDLRILVEPPTRAELLDLPPGECSAAVASRVARARERASSRGVPSNSHLRGQELERLAPFASSARRIVERALDTGRLSGRGLARMRTVALTIDDLADGNGTLSESAVAEALSLRADFDMQHHTRGVA